MLSLLNKDISRCAIRLARSKLKSSSPSARSRSLGQGQPRPKAEQLRSRWFASLAGRRTADRADLGVLQPSSLLDSSVRKTLPGLVCRYTSGTPSQQAKAKVTAKRASSPHPLVDLTMEEVEAFQSAKAFEEIPGPSLAQTIPFVGTRLLYHPFSDFSTADMGNMLSKLQATYGPIVRVKIGRDWLVLIENLTDIQRVVRASEQEELAKSKPPPKTNGSRLERLLNSKRVEDTSLSWLDGGGQSQKLRMAVAHHLNNNMAISQYLSQQEAIAEELVGRLQLMQDSAQEMQTLCYRYAIESAGQMCFNQRIGLLSEHYFSDGEKQKLVESFRTLVRSLGETRTGTRVLHLVFEDSFAKSFKDAKLVVQAWERKLMREATMLAIREKGASPLEPSERSLLITMMDDKSLTEQQIFDTMHALMTTGTDSVASSLQMLLFSLATNVDKQENLATEINQALGPEGKLTPSALESMDYLKAVVKESIRVHFPMCGGARVTLNNNIALNNYLVPSGVPTMVNSHMTMLLLCVPMLKNHGATWYREQNFANYLTIQVTIMVNSQRTAQNPLWFDHPHFFLPERWLGEAAMNIPTLAYMPFGFGTSHCPSRSFALQELYTAAVKILQRYKVDLPSEFHNGSKLDTIYTPFRSPKDPLPFSFTPRSGFSMPKKKSKKYGPPLEEMS